MIKFLSRLCWSQRERSEGRRGQKQLDNADWNENCFPCSKIMLKSGIQLKLKYLNTLNAKHNFKCFFHLFSCFLMIKTLLPNRCFNPPTPARSISFHLPSPCFSNVLHTSNVGCVVEGVELDQATAQARWSGALCYLWKHRSSIKSYFQLLKNMFSIIIYLIFVYSQMALKFLPLFSGMFTNRVGEKESKFCQKISTRTVRHEIELGATWLGMWQQSRRENSTAGKMLVGSFIVVFYCVVFVSPLFKALKSTE